MAVKTVARVGRPTQKECANGHKLKGDNLIEYERPDGYVARQCRECRNEKQREYREENESEYINRSVSVPIDSEMNRAIEKFMAEGGTLNQLCKKLLAKHFKCSVPPD